MLEEQKEERGELEEDIVTLVPKIQSKTIEKVDKEAVEKVNEEIEEAPEEVKVDDKSEEEKTEDPATRNWDRGIKSLTWKERMLGISQSRFALVLLSVTLSAILMGADYGSRSFGYMVVHAALVLTLGRCLFLLYKDATGHSFVDDIRQRLTGGRERSW